MLSTINKEPVRRPADPYPVGNAANLDLNRVSLVPLEHVQDGRYTFLRPINTDAYSADAELRKSTLKARSVLAAAFILGDLDAKYVNNGQEDFLLIGQTSTLLSAYGDFASMAAQQAMAQDGVKGIVPITDLDSGWRTQFGWISLTRPEVSDHFAFYSYIRPSIVWFGSRPESLQSVTEQRNLVQRRQRTVEEIFTEALRK